jgi:hypothetical protein
LLSGAGNGIDLLARIIDLLRLHAAVADWRRAR